MYAHLLVPTDGSKLSDKAVTHAIALAQALQAKITFFYASPDYPLPAYADGVVYEPVSKREYTLLAAKEADKVLDRAMTKATAAGVECTRMHSDRHRRRGRRSSRPPEESQVRRHRDGIARSPRPDRDAAGQRDAEGADARQAARAGRALGAIRRSCDGHRGAARCCRDVRKQTSCSTALQNPAQIGRSVFRARQSPTPIAARADTSAVPPRRAGAQLTNSAPANAQPSATMGPTPCAAMIPSATYPAMP